MIGQIIKVNSNKFTVLSNDEEFVCFVKGAFKTRSFFPVVGDFVEFNKERLIIKIFERKSYFIRPNVSNITQLVIVVSPIPKPDYLLIDKLILSARKENVKILILLNKSDITDALYNEFKQNYQDDDVKIVMTSVNTKLGLDDLKNHLKGELSCLCGQSAVGKTSLVNALFGTDSRVGDLSKIERGKQTTTHSQIYTYDGVKLLDSPGFAVLEADITLEELPELYPEYFALLNDCKFRTCSHVSEPNCAVKNAVSLGKLSKDRYDRYVKIYDEIKSRRKEYE
jgi:ribosome biogenesis GTPase